MDINKVWLSGLVCSEPLLSHLGSATPSCTFLLQVDERFTPRDGKPRVRSNYFHIESLGRSAAVVAGKVKKGARYFVDGYLRHDDSRKVDAVKVRAFAVYKDESADQALYTDGLRQAITILQTSRDKDTAMKTLEGLVASS